MRTNDKIIAFAAITDPARARAFYEEVLGLKLKADEPWALVFDAGGTMLRLQKAKELSPAPHTTLGWQVKDIKETVANLRTRGIGFERYGFLQQSDDGVWAAPDGAMIAWFKDPDGNLLSLTQL